MDLDENDQMGQTDFPTPCNYHRVHVRMQSQRVPFLVELFRVISSVMRVCMIVHPVEFSVGIPALIPSPLIYVHQGSGTQPSQ